MVEFVPDFILVEFNNLQFSSSAAFWQTKLPVFVDDYAGNPFLFLKYFFC